MKKTKRILGCILLVFALIIAQGCASTGNDSLRKATEESVSKKIVDGKTTKAEIKEMFGSPVSTNYTDSGFEIWKYELEKVSPDAINFIPYVNILVAGSSGVKKELTILFDDEDRVKKFNMSESKIKTRTGLLNQ